MRQHYSRLIATSLMIALVAITGAFAQTITGGDWGGANLDPADGAILSGTFTNVGAFTVQAGRTVYIEPGTVLSISAVSADIDGTIDGVGAGYTGGAPNGASSAGSPGAGPGGGGGGGFGNCVHSSGGGGGGYGGAGGNGGSAFGSSPSPAPGGATYGTASGPDIAMGSGGGAGGTYCVLDYGYPGAGGNGGGAIEIITSGALDVSGTINVNGIPGADGENLQGYPAAGGGGGAGGGIRLMGASGTITGMLSAQGGIGGSDGNGTGFNQAGGGGGGGRIKIATTICTSNSTLGGCDGEAGPRNPSSYSTTPATGGAPGTIDGGMGCNGDPAGGSASCTFVFLSSPVGGECRTVGQPTNITWTSARVANVRIDTSGNGGASYGTLATVPAAGGTYTWNVPTTQTLGSQTRVRIVDVADATVLDESGDFTMTGPLDADLAADREYLWSRTPDMFTVNIAGSATGGCTPVTTLQSITATDDGVPVADLTNDVQNAAYGTDDRSFDLRATMAPGAGGRVYRIVYNTVDDNGLTVESVVWVPVLPATSRAFHGPESPSSTVTLHPPSTTPLVTSTDISYTLTSTCATRVWIETLSGNRIVAIISPEQLQTAGTYTVTWNGNDAAGNPMPNGAYLIQIKGCAFKHVGVVIIER